MEDVGSQRPPSPAAGLIGLVGGIALAATLVLTGLMACVLPSSTWLLASAFSDEDTSPYTREQLVEAALAGRDYTVGSHSREALDRTLDGLVESLQWCGTYRDEDGTVHGLGAPSAAQLGEAYSLPADAISHLDDVWNVLQPVYASYLVAVAATAACLVALVRGARLPARRRRRALAAMLAAPAAVVLAAFVAFGVWAAVDFDGMFAAFHSLFFAAGSWTFSYESLLICMYPLQFWVGMAGIWLAVTVAGCAGCLAVARTLRA